MFQSFEKGTKTRPGLSFEITQQSRGDRNDPVDVGIKAGQYRAGLRSFYGLVQLSPRTGVHDNITLSHAGIRHLKDDKGVFPAFLY
jgi:hypothetical protein